MTIQALTYRVSPEGFVEHWLAAGPVRIPRASPEADALSAPARPRTDEPDYLRHFRRPVEWQPPLRVGTEELPWRYVRAGADHALDFADWTALPETRRTWLYAEVRCDRRGELRVRIKATGAVALWLGRQRLRAEASQAEDGARTFLYAGDARPGRNALFACHAQTFFDETASHFALALLNADAPGRLISLPTAVNPERRRGLEALIEASCLDKRVFGPQETVTVRWPAVPGRQAFLGLNLRQFRGPSFMEVMHTPAHAATQYAISTVGVAAAGPCQVVVRPGMDEYYEDNQRVTKSLDLHLLRADFERTPERNADERRTLLLEQAATYAGHVFGALAQAGLGTTDIAMDDVRAGLQEVAAGHAQAEERVLGLALLIRALPANARSAAAAEREREILAGLLRYAPRPRHRDSSRAFLAAACMAIVGHLQPDARLPGFGDARGAAIRDRGAARTRAWMATRLAQGFGGCDSQQDFARMLLACLCLQAMPMDEELADMATLLTDKALFTIALNSWKGVYGAAAVACDGEALQDARVGALAAVTFMAWGVGLPDAASAAGIALAQSAYAAPGVIQELGLFVPEALWSRERHGGTAAERAGEAEETHRWTYKTPDFMLSSLQDYRAGERGDRENPWLATLGCSARVHVNQPAYASERAAVPRNYWRGNATLPRVAQWQELVMAIYGPGREEGLGFTHAHFPLHAFDETTVEEQWAFARKEDGYLGLFAANGLALVTQGQGANRELRSRGSENVWICCLGRKAWDGDFVRFRTRIQASVTCQGLTATCASRAGQTVQFGWRGPLTVDGAVVSQRGELHYDSALCQASFPARAMTINGVTGRALELVFG